LFQLRLYPPLLQRLFHQIPKIYCYLICQKFLNLIWGLFFLIKYWFPRLTHLKFCRYVRLMKVHDVTHLLRIEHWGNIIRNFIVVFSDNLISEISFHKLFFSSSFVIAPSVCYQVEERRNIFPTHPCSLNSQRFFLN
jgi:hypothetical protein